jgi:hypothetical protein
MDIETKYVNISVASTGYPRSVLAACRYGIPVTKNGKIITFADLFLRNGMVYYAKLENDLFELLSGSYDFCVTFDERRVGETIVSAKILEIKLIKSENTNI